MLGISVLMVWSDACAALRPGITRPVQAPRDGEAVLSRRQGRGGHDRACASTMVPLQGSAPRVGRAAMLVRGDGNEGHHRRRRAGVGGDAHARQMLAAGVAHAERKMRLAGPRQVLAGGAVVLRFEAAEGLEEPRGGTFWSWGAGMWGGHSSPRWPLLPHRGDDMGPIPARRGSRGLPDGVERWPPPILPAVMAHAGAVRIT